MSLAETELAYRQDKNFTVTISLPAHVLPIRINTAKSSTQYDHQIQNSDAAAAAVPAQQSTSPTSRSSLTIVNLPILEKRKSVSMW